MGNGEMSFGDGVPIARAGDVPGTTFTKMRGIVGGVVDDTTFAKVRGLAGGDVCITSVLGPRGAQLGSQVYPLVWCLRTGLLPSGGIY